jgi:hypothetical protein
MRIIVVSLILLLCPVAARADGGGPVKPPVVGTVAQPPSVGSEAAIPPKPATKADEVPLGADTSTAGPDGKAESTHNGALSSPNTDKDAARRDHPGPIKPEDAAKAAPPM